MWDVLLIIIAFIGAFVLGVVGTIASEPYKRGSEVLQILEQCEKELPRNEFCEIVAVKKEGEL